VIESEFAGEGEPNTGKPFERIPAPRAGFMNMPPGTKVNPYPARHPMAEYKPFTDSKRAEIGRPVNVPRNVVTGDSAGLNYSSGRLDHLPYRAATWVERNRLGTLLDKLFAVWLAVASTIPNYLPADFPIDAAEVDVDWHWDGFPSIDPLKDAAAVEKRLALGLTTLAEECAAEGKNWRDVVDQRAEERKYMMSKGIDPDAGMKPAAAAPSKPTEPDDDEFDDDTALAPNRRAEAVLV
jgi:capsid protein